MDLDAKKISQLPSSVGFEVGTKAAGHRLGRKWGRT